MMCSQERIGSCCVTICLHLAQVVCGLLIAGNLPICAAEQPVGEDLFAVVLGVAQDGGYPQLGCSKPCCELAWRDPNERKFVSSIAVVDRLANRRFVFDCGPDFKEQIRLLDRHAPRKSNAPLVDGIFLTHGHIGHYTGLIHLGREALGASGIPVFGTERMNRYLTTNGPWSQLVELKNIELKTLHADKPIQLTKRLTVTAFSVPHRDEFTDTVGFRIASPTETLIYLPDIDKWSKWDRSIEEMVSGSSIALLDGTFYEDGELPGRDMATIPHPFISESIAQFASLDKPIRGRIRFIHLNHTNPAIQKDSNPKLNAAARQIVNAGMGLAKQGEVISLAK